MMHDAWCNTLVDLIFVRTVSIPNLILLPCLEVAYIFFWQTNWWADGRTKPFIEAVCCLKNIESRLGTSISYTHIDFIFFNQNVFWLNNFQRPKPQFFTQIKIPQSGICPAPCALCQCTVVFAWKCCLCCLCAHVQCRVCYIYHVEFHFRFRFLLSFPVKHQLWSGCHCEKSSKKNIR